MIQVIIPAYNEAHNLMLLIPLLQQMGYEPIVVDDGSTDNTWQVIKQNKVKGIRFSKNFGHAAAIRAGIHASDAPAIIIMDADFQHPPELLDRMSNLWKRGYDVVNTKKKIDTSLKRMSSILYYKLFNLISSTKLSSGDSDFKLLDKKVVDIIKDLPEKKLFLRAISSWAGFRQCKLIYKPAKRKYGKSKFTFSKMVSLAQDGFLGFSRRPMTLLFFLGILLTIGSGFFFIIAMLSKLFSANIFSSAALFGSLIILSNGIIMSILGMIGLYVIAIGEQVRERPDYVISEVQ